MPVAVPGNAHEFFDMLLNEVQYTDDNMTIKGSLEMILSPRKLIPGLMAICMYHVNNWVDALA